MKKTKIICTMGPSTNDKVVIKNLVEKGMDIARFNFSHGTHEEQKIKMDMLKQVREETGKPIAILLDTKGPEIRTGMLKNEESVLLKAGQNFTLMVEELLGDETKVSITYKELLRDIRIGDKILIDDGLIELKVHHIAENAIECKVINGGVLGQRKGVNVPGVKIQLPAITEKDKEDILFGIKQDIDFIAASFVRSKEAILEIRRILQKEHAPYIPIIAKIENEEGIRHIDEILEYADGIMIARGDLGVETPVEELPYVQKWLIQKCNLKHKPVITATQMLDSMIRNPRPTRAEVTDVANAVYDGTDAVMLSGETANGQYPVETLKTMVQIIEHAEMHSDTVYTVRSEEKRNNFDVSDAIGYASVATAERMQATCIVTPTMTGATARVVSKCRPKVMIIGVTPDDRTMRRMQIYRGVLPVRTKMFDTQDMVYTNAIEVTKEMGMIQKGDVIVMTMGIPSPVLHKTKKGMSNMMSIAKVE